MIIKYDIIFIVFLILCVILYSIYSIIVKFGFDENILLLILATIALFLSLLYVATTL